MSNEETFKQSDLIGGSEIDKPFSSFEIKFNIPQVLKAIEVYGLELYIESSKTDMEESIKFIFNRKDI